MILRVEVSLPPSPLDAMESDQSETICGIEAHGTIYCWFFFYFRFHCECNRGYKPAYFNRKCEDVNECEILNGGCNKPNQECVNVIGSHYCKCSNGFTTLDKS